MRARRWWQSLNLMVPKRLAGQTLRLSIKATDVHGRT